MLELRKSRGVEGGERVDSPIEMRGFKAMEQKILLIGITDAQAKP